MNKNLHIIVFTFLSFSFFAFGWLSNVAYEPGKKIQKISNLQLIKRKKVLNVVLLNTPTTYYIGTDGPKGFEYDLLLSYSKYIGVKLNITTVGTVKEALALSKDPLIDIISASVTKTSQRKETLNFGPSYFEVQEQVVCSRKMQRSSRFPRNVEDLSGLNIVVGEETSYEETINSLIADGFDINATYSATLSTEELLEQVSKHKIDCTIVDSNIYALNLRYFPEIRMAFAIGSREQLAWVFSKESQN
jgi:membrane-bound lytic murein transglycosylase F